MVVFTGMQSGRIVLVDFVSGCAMLGILGFRDLKYANYCSNTDLHLVGYLLDREPGSSQPHNFITIEDGIKRLAEATA